MFKLSGLIAALVLTSAAAFAQPAPGIESSYHGQLGFGTGLGMLEKWCALPNFSYDQQGGVAGWTSQTCNDCHIGAAWNPTRPAPLCRTCHGVDVPTAATPPAVANCMSCHKKDTEKRGDLFTVDTDIHLAAGLACQDCHVRISDASSDHQFAKGRVLDTTEPTLKGTLACVPCHPAQPHASLGDRGLALDEHLDKVACETCHTGPRPGGALASRQWNVFTVSGGPVSVMRQPGFMPVYKWYDGTGPGAAGDYHIPVLGVTERRNAPGAKIHPFNPITVSWYVKKKNSSYDQVIPVPQVKAADVNGDRTVTLDEIRKVYRQATLVTADMNFSVSHSVRPAAQAFLCSDCHGRSAWVLDWKALGYAKDPRVN